MNKRSDIGVIIGRFQPFHLGHAWIIKESLKKFDKIIILIGSSNIADENNPWDLKKRLKMLEQFLESEKISDRVIKIGHIIDVPDDKEWLDMAISKIGENSFTIIGDNEWVNGIFEEAGYAVWRPGFFHRDKYEGSKIRKLYNDSLDWKSRIPEHVIKIIE